MGGGVEFVCGHCASRSLWLVAVNQEHVTVECLTCGKQSTIDRTGAPRLVLVTCGGAWDPERRSYTENVVVTAERSDG